MSISASAVNAVSINVSWSVLNSSASAFLNYTVSGIGISTVTGTLYPGQTASGTPTATGLSPTTSYTYTVSGSYSDGSTYTGSSASATTQGYTDLSLGISYSGTTSGTLTYSGATVPPATWSVTGTSYTVKQFVGMSSTGSTIASGSTNSGSTSISGLSYSTTYTWQYTQSWTSNGYSTSKTATTSYTTSAAPSYPPAWSDQTLAGFTAGAVYSDGVTATNMSYSGNYSISVGALPSGISLNTSTGAVTGTPNTSGQTYSFTIRAQNTYGSVTKAFSGTVAAPPSPPTWTDTAISDFVANRPYTDSVAATNSPAYTVSAGSLPAGVALNSTTGALTGTPTGAVHAYSFTIKASNGTSPDITQSYSGYIGGLLYHYADPSWISKPVKIYNGTSWVAGTVYVYNGSSWVPSI